MGYYYSKCIKIISLLLTLGFGLLFFCITFYIHEFGHVFFGALSNIIHHKTFSIPYFSNCVKCFLIPVPQQTHIDLEATLLFTIGGITTTLITIYYVFVKFLPKKIDRPHILFIVFFLLFFIHEIIGNMICGTDNHIGDPLLSCDNYIIFSIFLKSIPFLVGIVFSLIFYREVEKFLKKLYKMS